MSGAAPVRLSDRLVAVIESFLTKPHQTLSEVSAACGMEPSTATRYLRQLVEHGWLERDDQRRTYELGVRLIEIGQAARMTRPLRRIMLPYMRELLERLDETINLAVHQRDEVLIIEALESGRSIRRGATIGDHDGWFDSSLGKSILAHMPERQVLDLLAAHPPRQRTPNTLVDRDAILADLAKVRERGYAIDDEEAEIGLKCVGVPIRDHHGRYSHALSISGPTARINDRLEEITAALCAAADAAGRGSLEEVS
jgi:IclR family acetate operon transcriptional repressor